MHTFSDYRHQNGFSTNEIGYERAIHMDDEVEDPQDVQSDIDSQVCTRKFNQNHFINIVNLDVAAEILYTATRIQI